MEVICELVKSRELQSKRRGKEVESGLRDPVLTSLSPNPWVIIFPLSISKQTSLLAVHLILCVLYPGRRALSTRVCRCWRTPQERP